MSIEIVRKAGKWAPESSPEYDGTRAEIVVLTTGYQVDLADPTGLDHLMCAVFLETLTRIAPIPDGLTEFSPTLKEECIRELFYVAGQLRESEAHRMDYKFLCEQFAVRWNRFNGDSADTCALN